MIARLLSECLDMICSNESPSQHSGGRAKTALSANAYNLGKWAPASASKLSPTQNGLVHVEVIVPDVHCDL
jgi:hypothetical protein